MGFNDHKRVDRIGELIKEELSMLLLREVRDPRIGFITLTGVKMSGDLRLAKVYFSMIGSEEDRCSTLEGLGKAKGYLKRELAKRLNLRCMPDIIFYFDTSVEYGERIESIIRRIKTDG